MTTIRYRFFTLPVLAAVLAMPAMPQGKGGDNDPDRAVAGAGLPAGMAVTLDPGRGKAAPTPSKVSQTGGLTHFTMGGGGAFYNNSWTKTGDYKYSARVKMTKPPTHPTSYGIFVGGKDMAGMPTYTYFLVRNQGEFFIASMDGGARKVVTDWTKNAAVKTGDADVLEIEVKGADVMFRVNGTEVAKLPKAQLHTDGLVGYRIGHNIDVDIDEVKR
jgi:hypothetical protein